MGREDTDDNCREREGGEKEEEERERKRGKLGKRKKRKDGFIFQPSFYISICPILLEAKIWCEQAYAIPPYLHHYLFTFVPN